ncbi:MAG: hypothetical protein NZ805_09150 [Armatimonadetes bacterium]|nr:hypothetical protein [Armatimonadota bacterium]MDW8028370.1 hypothetical protein [Armatimonadota bacterium]
MRIAILGAGSDVGRVISHSILMSDLVSEGDEVVLIGRKGGRSEFIVRGMAEDFAEAFIDKEAKIIPSIDPKDAWGDLLIFIASVPDPAHFTRIFHRERLAQDNCKLVQQLLPTLKSNRERIGWVIVVTNPNELVVKLLGDALENDRIVATGSLVDTYRFRLEIARDLNVKPSQVDAWAGGEHGPNMLFFWSTVKVNGQMLDEKTMKNLRCPSFEYFEQKKTEAFQVAEKVLEQEGLDAAYQALRPFPTEVRAIVKSYLTHTSGAKTGGVASQAVLKLMKAILCDKPTLLCAQTFSEFGTVGIPIALSRKGIAVKVDILSDDEKKTLSETGKIVQRKIEAIINSQ